MEATNQKDQKIENIRKKEKEEEEEEKIAYEHLTKLSTQGDISQTLYYMDCAEKLFKYVLNRLSSNDVQIIRDTEKGGVMKQMNISLHYDEGFRAEHFNDYVDKNRRGYKKFVKARNNLNGESIDVIIKL